MCVCVSVHTSKVKPDVECHVYCVSHKRCILKVFGKSFCRNVLIETLTNSQNESFYMENVLLPFFDTVETHSWCLIWSRAIFPQFDQFGTRQEFHFVTSKLTFIFVPSRKSQKELQGINSQYKINELHFTRMFSHS